MIFEFNILRSCLSLPWPFVIVDHLPKNFNASKNNKSFTVVCVSTRMMSKYSNLKWFAPKYYWGIIVQFSYQYGFYNIATHISLFTTKCHKTIQHFPLHNLKNENWNHLYRWRQNQVLESCFWTNMIDTTEQILRSHAKKHEFDLSPTFFGSHNHHNKYSTKDVSFTCASCSFYFCCVSFFFLHFLKFCVACFIKT